MTCFNKITSSQNQAFPVSDLNGPASFDDRIRAAKANGTQIIPERDLSEFEWTTENSYWRVGADLRHERQTRREN